MANATVSLTKIYETLRERVAAFTDGAADTITEYLGPNVGNQFRLYRGRPGSNIPAGAMYAVMRVELPRTREGWQISAALFVEIMVFGRGPVTVDAVAIEPVRAVARVGDLIQGALRLFTVASASDGLIRITNLGRQDVPQGTGDADSTVVSERHVFEGYAYVRYLFDQDVA